MGDPLEWLMRDWADAAHAQGGLAVAVHFPLPYAEIAADIVCGRIDAVEMQALTPGVDGPSIREWYRFLACGYRLPVVGGTDKMSAEVPVGAIRTYARLDPERPLSFAGLGRGGPGGPDVRVVGRVHRPRGRWPRAGRRRRASVRGGGTVEVRVHGVGRAAGHRRDRAHPRRRVVATSGGAAADRTAWSSSERVTVASERLARGAGRRAARTSTRRSRRAWAPTARRSISTSAGRRPFAVEDAAVIGTIIDGARTWVETIAAVRSPAERARLAEYFASSRATLDELGPRDRYDAADSGGR